MKTRSIILFCCLTFFAFLRTVSGQGVSDTNSQPSAITPLAINSLQEQVNSTGVLSGKPFLAAWFSVTLLCLIWAGIMFKQRKLRKARHWLFAAIASVMVWMLAALIVEFVIA
jgi:TRAP-type C4-dicarboxylate transport system permease small subunit